MAMKCKKHPSEQGAGVCASCLRERLLAVIVAQNQLSPENHRRNPPPPLLFPRSVSPYVSHRRSVDSDVSDASDVDRHHHHRFYRTPQVRNHRSEEGKREGGCRRFPLLSSFFSHNRPEEGEHSGWSSWFSALIHGRRMVRKKKKMSPVRKMKAFGAMDRGMSPVRDEETDSNVSESEYSTELSAGLRRPTTPRRTVAAHHRRHSGGFSGFAVCLSPLVRPSPANRRGQPPEVPFSGELRSVANSIHNRRVSVGDGSFGPNRSRKLADRGRFR